MNAAIPAALSQAIRLIQTTPGYAEVSVHLAQLASEGRIRIDPDLPDRAQAGLLGTITIGPEAAEAGVVSLAQTLVHEHFHLHQNLLLKTASFWTGLVTRTPVMRRYEQPAYQAGVDFLEVVRNKHPHLAGEAQAEENAIRQVFAGDFGGTLN